MAYDPALHMRRTFVYFLQNLFRTAPEGTGLRWNPEPETSEIVISAEKPQLSAIEKRPHITCILGASRWAGIGLDQMKNVRSSDGMRTHTDLVPSIMAYHCQAAEGVVATRIAWLSSWMTAVFRRIIHRAGNIHHVDPKHEISAETPPTAFSGPTAKSDCVSVVVTVPFYWQPQWRITEPAELWRRVIVELSVLKTLPVDGMVWEDVKDAHGNVIGKKKVPVTPEVAFKQIVWDSSLEEKE
jgi:hypothetical protein